MVCEVKGFVPAVRVSSVGQPMRALEAVGGRHALGTLQLGCNNNRGSSNL